MKPGDVCLAYFPFTNASAAKLRPILVVSAETFNSGEDVVVLPISSAQGDRYSVHIDSSSPWFEPSGLKYPSWIKWSKPQTISKSLIVRHIGSLPAGGLAEIYQNLVSMFQK